PRLPAPGGAPEVAGARAAARRRHRRRCGALLGGAAGAGCSPARRLGPRRALGPPGRAAVPLSRRAHRPVPVALTVRRRAGTWTPWARVGRSVPRSPPMPRREPRTEPRTGRERAASSEPILVGDG